jgi:hypothetical protein
MCSLSFIWFQRWVKLSKFKVQSRCELFCTASSEIIGSSLKFSCSLKVFCSDSDVAKIYDLAVNSAWNRLNSQELVGHVDQWQNLNFVAMKLYVPLCHNVTKIECIIWKWYKGYVCWLQTAISNTYCEILEV